MRRWGAVGLTITLLAVCAYGDTFGSPLIQRSYPGVDSCTGCLFAYVPVPVSEVGQTLISWAFYDQDIYTNDAGHLITPILFQLNPGLPTLQIVAIGTTQVNTNTGLQAHPFGLVAGNNVLAANEYFGWRDGNASGSVINNGNVSLDLSGGSGLYYHTDTPGPPPYQFTAGIGVGQSYSFIDTSTTTREYSIQATATPEPGAIMLLGTAMLACAGLMRRLLRA